MKKLEMPANFAQMSDFEQKFAVRDLVRQMARNALAELKNIPPENIFMWDYLKDYGITSADIVPLLQKVDMSLLAECLEITPVTTADCEETFGNKKWVDETLGNFADNLHRLISYKKSEAMAILDCKR